MTIGDFEAADHFTKNMLLPYLLEGTVQGIEVCNEILSRVDAMLLGMIGSYSYDGDPASIQSGYKLPGYSVAMHTDGVDAWAQFSAGDVLLWDSAHERWFGFTPPDGVLFYVISVAGTSPLSAGFLCVKEGSVWKPIPIKANANFTKSTQTVSSPPTGTEVNTIRQRHVALVQLLQSIGGPTQ